MTTVARLAVLASVLAGCGGALGETPPDSVAMGSVTSNDVRPEPSADLRLPLQEPVEDTHHTFSPDPPPPIHVPEGTSERGAFSFEPDDTWYSFQREMERDIGFSFPHDPPPEGTRMLEKIDDGVW